MFGFFFAGGKGARGLGAKKKEGGGLSVGMLPRWYYGTILGRITKSAPRWYVMLGCFAVLVVIGAQAKTFNRVRIDARGSKINVDEIEVFTGSAKWAPVPEPGGWVNVPRLSAAFIWGGVEESPYAAANAIDFNVNIGSLARTTGPGALEMELKEGVLSPHGSCDLRPRTPHGHARRHSQCVDVIVGRKDTRDTALHGGESFLLGHRRSL